MTGDRVALVGCGSAKQTVRYEVQARNLYTSHYFYLKRRYAELYCDDWRILSAQHGLLRPIEPVRPYDCSIHDLNVVERSEWAHDVYEELLELDGVGEHVLLAGQAYLEPLEAALADLTAGREMVYPFEGTAGIGEQMEWLREQLDGVGAEDESQADHSAFSGGDD